MRNLVLLFILTFTFNAFSAPINESLKDEERIVYDKYNHIRNEINYLLEDYYTNNLSPGIKCNVLKKAKKETHPNDK